jgi:Fic family protein
MKTPTHPPPEDQMLQQIKTNSRGLFQILEKVPEPTVDGRYAHWHKLRFYPPPEGISHLEWWHALKLRRRNSSRQISLEDKSGEPFWFCYPDPLPERLHNIDSLARGVVGMPEQVTNSDTKNRYLVRSLIEEAITSSQLEGASTTREVAKEMIRQGREPHDRSERMIFSNYKTMQRIGGLRGEPMTREILFEIHRLVTDGTLDDPAGAGRFRRADEAIVVGDDEGQVFHVPPAAGQLARRLEEMCAFANGETPGPFVHPVIRSIILHFWLAYDHPFIDGNGRTARALFYWSMLRQAYWLFEFISISEIIVRAPVKYGMAFLYTETDGNDLTYFLLYKTGVIMRAIDRLNEYIQKKTESVRRLETDVRGMSALNHRQRTLIGHALRHPGQRYTIESHRTSHGVVYQTARTDLLGLADLGLLKKYKQGKTWYFVPGADLGEKLKALG